jgi:large subunit ribosomal protein L9
MRVLLRQNVRDLGSIGEVVDVAPGFARNYLLPRQLAVQPTDVNVKRVEKEKLDRIEAEKARVGQLEALAKRMADASVTIKAKANELGHLFGSVNERHIADALQAEGFEVEPDQIALAAPIRTLDRFRVPVRLAEGIEAEVDVWVVPTD